MGGGLILLHRETDDSRLTIIAFVMSRVPVFLLLASLCLALGCSPADVPSGPSATPLPSETPTATTDWFPATATFTPLPPNPGSPTPDMRSGLDEVLLAEDFADESFWSVSVDEEASARIENSQLHLSLRARRAYLITTRTEPTFNDFYAEITAHTHLCRDEDQFGFVLRADASGSHYRFVLSCDGRARVDRLYQGGFSNVLDWQSHPNLPSVVPASVRLGVWADGQQLRFFVDDAYLFSVTDTLLYSGMLGAFVYTSTDADVSVSFSDLVVWSLEQ